MVTHRSYAITHRTATVTQRLPLYHSVHFPDTRKEAIHTEKNPFNPLTLKFTNKKRPANTLLEVLYWSPLFRQTFINVVLSCMNYIRIVRKSQHPRKLRKGGDPHGKEANILGRRTDQRKARRHPEEREEHSNQDGAASVFRDNWN